MRPSKVVTGSSGTHKRKAFNLAVQFKSIWPEIIFIYPWENSGGKSVLIVSSLRPFCRHLTGFDVEKEKKKREKKSNSRGNGSMIYIYIYIIFEWNESKQIWTGVVHQRQQIVYRINIWFVATILRIFVGTTVQTGVIQFRQTRPDYAFVDTCSCM